MNEKATRAAFEKWYSDACEWPRAVEKDGRGEYRYAGASAAWEAWKAASERADRAQWQPIDTAPKDGSSILAFFPGLGQMVAFYNADGANNAGHWSVGFDYYGCPPTHWKYLCADPV